MDEVKAGDDPTPKQRKVTDYFTKLPSNTEAQEFLQYLRRYQPTDVPRRPKRPVGRPRKNRPTDPHTSGDSTEGNTISRSAYRSYSLKQKLEIVRYAQQNSEAAASRRYGVSRSTIYGWRNIDKEPIKKVATASKGKHLKKGAGRPFSYPQERDEELLAWVLRQRDLQLTVRRIPDIQLKATTLITPDHPNFKASYGWVNKFMHRHSLSLRAKTSIQQKLPAQLEEKLEKFVKNIKDLREMHHFPDTMVINMDETPMYFDMPGSHTVHKKGCREVRIRSTGAEKRRLTVILACTAAGDMLPPMAIFKGKRALKNLRIPAGVVVKVQPKGWNDSELTKVWIQKVLYRYTAKQHALLVWDTFTGHMTEDVAEELQKNNISVAVIPGGCTSKIQPLDVSLIKPFKTICRSQWVEYMQQEVAKQQSGERLKPASKQQVVDWVVQSNKLLDEKKEIIRKSFLVCGISNALDGSQNNLIRCAKELSDMSIAYGDEESAQSESESDDPFGSGSDSETELSDVTQQINKPLYIEYFVYDYDCILQYNYYS